jgi:hypothetical protein
MWLAPPTTGPVGAALTRPSPPARRAAPTGRDRTTRTGAPLHGGQQELARLSAAEVAPKLPMQANPRAPRHRREPWSLLRAPGRTLPDSHRDRAGPAGQRGDRLRADRRLPWATLVASVAAMRGAGSHLASAGTGTGAESRVTSEMGSPPSSSQHRALLLTEATTTIIEWLADLGLR